MKRVLIVEDQTVIAKDLANMVETSGNKVIGRVETVSEAEEAITGGGIDIALLDIDIGGGQEGVALGQLLKDVCGAVVVFVTAVSIADLPKIRYPYRFVSKPYSQEVLVGILNG